MRKLLKPILKLFFNPNPLIEALHIQSKLNAQQAGAGAALLRGDSQPRARNDAARDRRQEPEDAGRVDVEPARFRRAAGARARRRRAVPAGHRRRRCSHQAAAACESPAAPRPSRRSGGTGRRRRRGRRRPGEQRPGGRPAFDPAETHGERHRARSTGRRVAMRDAGRIRTETRHSTAGESLEARRRATATRRRPRES